MSEKASPEGGPQGAELIASALVTREELEELVQPFPVDAFFLGEHLPGRVVDDNRQMRRLLVRFARLSEVRQEEQTPFPWTVYTWGRVFCEEGELRWDGSEGELRVVYLGQERLLPARLREYCRPLMGLKRPSVNYYLLGESPRQVKAWEVGVSAEEEQYLFLTTRIPRLLFYPVNERRVEGQRYRAKLTIRLYQDAETGATVYFRFAGLESEIIRE
jgi:hypothetical protein